METSTLQKPNGKNLIVSYVDGRKQILAPIIHDSFMPLEPDLAVRGKSSHPRSWIMDCRKGLATTPNLQAAADWFVKILDSKNINQIVLKGYGAYLLGGAILTTSYKPITASIVREKRKRYDLNKQTEGILDITKPMLYIDDILNSGSSTIEGFRKLEMDEGIRRDLIYCAFLIKYMWGKGELNLQKRGIKNIYHAMEVKE